VSVTQQAPSKAPRADERVGAVGLWRRLLVMAFARAVHSGARVLILDEPTSALGVKQAGVVLRCIAQARDRGLGVVSITHDPHHAHPVGDRFLLLDRGRSMGDFAKGELSREELTGMMAGGDELTELAEELERPPAR
jgi:simple sugar transport system ATP-binding protein